MMRLLSRLLHRLLRRTGRTPTPVHDFGVFVSGYRCRAFTICAAAAGVSWLALGDSLLSWGALLVLALVSADVAISILDEGTAGLWDRFQAWRDREPV